MVLAKGIFSPSGMLLVPEGHRLTEGSLARIQKQKSDTYDNQKLIVFC
jgi:hypothetical protein